MSRSVAQAPRAATTLPGQNTLDGAAAVAGGGAEEAAWVRPLRRTMQRFGGRPYWDGRVHRCPDCNGIVDQKTTDYDAEGREVRPHHALICRVCRRRAG